MAELRESGGRWKYLVVLGAAIVNFFNTGTAKSFGVLVPDLKHEFNTGVAIIGFGIGMCHGVAVGLTFITRPLLRRTTCRVLTVIGGLGAGMAFTFCSVSSSAVMFTFGIFVAGLGYSLMIISNIVIVKDYFGGSYAAAVSFSFAGGGLGMMLIPVITEKLANIYGWRGALLILAGLNFHTAVAGALFKPLSSNSRQCTTMPNAADEATDEAPDCARRPQSNSEVGRFRDIHCSPKESDRDYEESKDENENCSLVERINEGYQSSDNDSTIGARSGISGVLDAFDLRLMYDYPAINTAMIAGLLFGATNTGWVAFLVPSGVTKGYDMDKAVFLASIGGSANIIGRFVGFAKGRGITARAMFATCSIVCGVAFCLNYVTSAFYGLCILAMVNGFTLGAMLVLICLMVEEIVDDSRFTSGVALAYIFLGLGEITGGLFAGWLHDVTHTYDMAFIALGCMNFCGAILTLMSFLSCS